MTTIKRPLVRAVHCRPDQTPHGCLSDLVVTINPDGLLSIRPYRTKTAPAVAIPLAKLYASQIVRMLL